MTEKYHLFATATTSGLSLASIGEFLRSMNWQNAVTVLVSVGSAAISWYVSVRQAKREQDRLDREASREQRREDALQELSLLNVQARASAAPPTGAQADPTRCLLPPAPKPA